MVLSNFLISIIILLSGYLILRLGSWVHNRTKQPALHDFRIRYFRNTVLVLTVLLALLYLKVGALQTFFDGLLDLLPGILAFLLTIFLGIIIANFLVISLEKILFSFGVSDLMRQYKKEQVFRLLLNVFRIMLYIILVFLSLIILGADLGSWTIPFNVLFYSLLAVLLLSLFVTLLFFFRNLGPALYFKSSRYFREGSLVKIDGVSGRIERMTLLGVHLHTKDGFTLYLPFEQLMKKSIMYKAMRFDMNSLNKIVRFFQAQDPSACGPASAAMVLSIWGIEVSQKYLQKLAGTAIGKGTHPQAMIDAVERHTKRKVIGVWIDVDKISNLREEVQSWLTDGALLIVDFKKSYLFPDSKKAHYSVCVALEGDELVILDPSGTNGGVYLVNHNRMFQGMNTYSEFLESKRGYIVLAQEGSHAYYRMRQGLYYSDITVYDKLTTTLKKEASRLATSVRTVDMVMPDAVKKYLKRFQSQEMIRRLWEPDSVKRTRKATKSKK